MWNYRVMRQEHEKGEWFGIYEVYYDEGGKIWSWSKSPMEPFGDTPQDLLSSIGLMAMACERPVLEYDMEAEACDPWGDVLEKAMQQAKEDG